MLRTSVMNQLVTKGKTIQDLDKDGQLSAHGCTQQREYIDKAVWHTLGTIREQVADEMKIDEEMIKRDGEFYRKTRDVLCGIQKKGLVSGWCSWNWKIAFRLTNSDHRPKPINPPKYIDISPPYNERPTIEFGEECDMKRVFSAIITPVGKKDNTYKFVLAKVILDYCQTNDSHDIPYEYLADKFLEHYWYQEYKFKMKQDFKTVKKPRVIIAIRNVFGKNPPSDFSLLDKNDILVAKKQILNDIFGHARKKTSMVVPRFQNIPGNDGDTIEYRIFYEYDDDKQMIYWRSEAFEFFKRNHLILSKAVIAEWAKFLERINGTLPYLVSKIEAPTKKRESLTEYYNMYSKHEDCCFYCGARLDKKYTDVDHFIPWSYIFSNDPWNLVLACRPCNAKKSDYLPHEKFKQYLISRNRAYYDKIKAVKDSLNMLDMGRGWEPEIDNHYITCMSYGFGKINLP